MSNEIISVEKVGQAVILTLNHPPLNALSHKVVKALDLSLSEVLTEKSCRCLIITGYKDEAFASGADIRELENLDERSGRALVERVKEVFHRIRTCSIPTIAAINAHALGGGLELALHCDFRVAAENIRLGLPEINLGVMPGAGGTQLLPQLIGLAKARWMIMHGEIVDSETAFRIGLLDRVVKGSELIGDVLKIASVLAEKPPLSLNAVKKAFQAGEALPLAGALQEESRLFGMLCATRDKKEGIMAFLDKRKPSFQGR